MSLKQIFILVLASLFAVAQAKTSHGAQDDLTLVKLLTRQDLTDCSQFVSDPDTPLCRALCAPSSFSCSSNSIDKRHEVLVPGRAIHNYSIVGDSYENHLVARRLGKRAFAQITQGQIGTYLPNQFEAGFDPIYGQPAALVTNPETDDTVMVQQAFGAAAFAVGARGLHGCTMVTIVSSQAVYMGHLWEGSGWSVSATGRDWTRGVLNFYRGGPTQGQGPALNPALFPAGDPNTRVYIMSPRKASSPYTSQYRAKVPMLQQAIRDGLGYQDVPQVLYNYPALEYEDPDDQAQIGNGPRGNAVFQFDPNGNGPGQPAWRLFYENHQFNSNDPPPNSPRGIPDI